MRSCVAVAVAIFLAFDIVMPAGRLGEPARESLVLRGRAQTLLTLGNSEGPPVIVSSGDGGWIHLAPHVAQLLASRGYDVLGFDTRTYLETFTSTTHVLDPADVRSDYAALAARAAGRSHWRPILVGVSEGAGLSVLAATSPQARSAFGGVVAIGLPAVNELAWRWKDSVIYLTHATANEPGFSVKPLVAGLSPVPFAAIHSTHDEYAPLQETEKVLASAGQPKQLWTVAASDHRFSDKLPEFDERLLEALAWVSAHASA